MKPTKLSRFLLFFCCPAVFVLHLLLVFFSCKKEEPTHQQNGGGAGNGFCECTDYVGKELGLVHYKDAADWTEQTLVPAGTFTLQIEPQSGDVAVFARGYNGANASAGHVGFVSTATKTSTGYSVTVRGARQSGPAISACGCNNISDWEAIQVSTDDITAGKIKFYREPNLTFNCGAFYNPNAGKRIAINGDLSFGNVSVGSFNTRTITVSNPGNDMLTITGISLPSAYTCGWTTTTLPPTGSKPLTVTFHPAASASYNGTLNVASDASGGTSMIPITGSGFITAPMFSTLPLQGDFTACPPGDQPGSCSANPYLGGTIKMSCTVTLATITITIQKCSGTFGNTGKAFIKEGGVCGTILSNANGVDYNSGVSNVTIQIPNNILPGQTKFLYGVVLSNNNPAVNRFYTLPISITRN